MSRQVMKGKFEHFVQQLMHELEIKNSKTILANCQLLFLFDRCLLALLVMRSSRENKIEKVIMKKFNFFFFFCHLVTTNLMIV